jgi:F-type H+-transporting ATPase subunit b
VKRWFGVTLLAAAMAMGTAALAQEHEGAHEGAAHAEGFHQPDPINWTSVGGQVVHHDEHGREVTSPRPPPFVGPLINFAILLVLGYMAITRSINPSLQARRASVESEIAEAKRLHDEAQAMHAEMTAKLGSLDAEIDTLKAQFTAAGEAERDRIVAEAHARVERMRADGSAAIEQEVQNLREGLRREAIIAATSAAEATVRATIGADDQKRLADEYLANLESAGTEGARA